MIYIHARSVGEVFECDTPQEAIATIASRRLLPADLRIWQANTPLVEIAFEDLQQMVGHDPLDVAIVNREVDLVLSQLQEAFRGLGLDFTEYDDKRCTSTSGIPSGHPAVSKMFGHPCVRVSLRLNRAGHLHGEPRSLGPTELAEMVARAAENPAMPGWVMLHSSCSVVMRIPNIRPFREIEMFLSRPRATFDKEAEDVQ